MEDLIKGERTFSIRRRPSRSRSHRSFQKEGDITARRYRILTAVKKRDIKTREKGRLNLLEKTPFDDNPIPSLSHSISLPLLSMEATVAAAEEAEEEEEEGAPSPATLATG